jgi:GTP-binding protein
MNIINAELSKVAVGPSQYPVDGLPEIAFIGRSNVGKSTLINAFLNRKALARTSNTPGKTRTINFYKADNLAYLVDLPGYGYAKLSRSESAKWGKMIETYLKRDELKLAVLLLDIRREPNGDDLRIFEWLSYYKKETRVIATKADKVSKNILAKNISVIIKALELPAENAPIPFSGLTRAGRDEIWDVFRQYI